MAPSSRFASSRKPNAASLDVNCCALRKVEARLGVAGKDDRAPRCELLRSSEDADDLAIRGIRRHPYQVLGERLWRAAPTLPASLAPLGALSP